MNKIIKNLPKIISKEFLNIWLEKNIDKKNLSDNFLDGHGFYKDGDSCITVYVIKKSSLIFMFNRESEDYTWKILGDDEWVRYTDVEKHPFKMKARF